MCEMPDTTVQKMIGAITILMSLTKPSPSALIQSFLPTSGSSQPTMTPSTMAIRTWTYKILYQGLAGFAAAGVGVATDVGAIRRSAPDPAGQMRPRRLYCEA